MVLIEAYDNEHNTFKGEFDPEKSAEAVAE